jgi:hypothetical protein
MKTRQRDGNLTAFPSPIKEKIFFIWFIPRVHRVFSARRESILHQAKPKYLP